MVVVAGFFFAEAELLELPSELGELELEEEEEEEELEEESLEEESLDEEECEVSDAARAFLGTEIFTLCPFAGLVGSIRPTDGFSGNDGLWSVFFRFVGLSSLGFAARTLVEETCLPVNHKVMLN